jgi:hypothetical protein
VVSAYFFLNVVKHDLGFGGGLADRFWEILLTAVTNVTNSIPLCPSRRTEDKGKAEHCTPRKRFHIGYQKQQMVLVERGILFRRAHRSDEDNAEAVISLSCELGIKCWLSLTSWL